MAFVMSIYRVVLVLVLSATYVTAQQSENITALTTPEAAGPWRAVGRLDMKPSIGWGWFELVPSLCTATLIEPDILLTAAHCLYDTENNKPFAPDTMIFRAGLTYRHYFAKRYVWRYVSHPKYDPENYHPAYDVALVQLDEPIPTEDIVPFEVLRVGDVGSYVSIVSYGENRLDYLTEQRLCQFTNSYTRWDWHLFDCHAVPGTSGAPIFDIRGRTPRIVSIASGGDGISTSAPARVASHVEELKLALSSGVGVVSAKTIPSGRQDTRSQRRITFPAGVKSESLPPSHLSD